MSELNIKFGQRLKQIRESRGLSQEKLGELIGLSEDSVGNMERGKHWPRLKTLEKLLETLNIKPKDLFDF